MRDVLTGGHRSVLRERSSTSSPQTHGWIVLRIRSGTKSISPNTFISSTTSILEDITQDLLKLDEEMEGLMKETLQDENLSRISKTVVLSGLGRFRRGGIKTPKNRTFLGK